MILALPHRALLRISGEDAASFLQGLITQDVAQVDAGGWRWSALLSPQGKLLFDFLIRREGDAFLLDCEATRRADLVKRLTLYRLRAKVLFEPMEAQIVAGWDAAGPEGGVPDLRHPGLGWRGTGNAEAAPDLWRQHRLGLGIAEGAAELGVEKLLWLESNADLLGGVSFTKGCYVGQENTARMHHRSKVRKRVLTFRSDGSGEAIMAGDRTAADVLWLKDGIGSALMRLEWLDAPLALGDAAVTLIRPDWLEPALKSD